MSDSTIRVLSFNIRTAPAERTTAHAWPSRRGICRDAILRGGYDFVGVQEAWFSPEEPATDQAGDLARDLAGYGMLGTSRDPDPAHGEGAPVFYRKDRWELDAADQGTLWLSDTPGVRASRLPDATHSRVLVWGRFHELSGGRRTGRTFLFSNTHLDYLYEHTALLQAAIADRLLAERARPGEPVVLAGDFNMYEGSWPVRYLRGEALPLSGAAMPPPRLPLRDAWRETNPGAPDERSFHAWHERSTEKRRIDYVFFAGGLKAKAAAFDRDARDGAFPSDHYPLSAEFERP